MACVLNLDAVDWTTVVVSGITALVAGGVVLFAAWLDRRHQGKLASKRLAEEARLRAGAEAREARFLLTRVLTPLMVVPDITDMSSTPTMESEWRADSANLMNCLEAVREAAEDVNKAVRGRTRPHLEGQIVDGLFDDGHADSSKSSG